MRQIKLQKKCNKCNCKKNSINSTAITSGRFFGLLFDQFLNFELQEFNILTFFCKKYSREKILQNTIVSLGLAQKI